jgi:hypothetical protein
MSECLPGHEEQWQEHYEEYQVLVEMIEDLKREMTTS